MQVRERSGSADALHRRRCEHAFYEWSNLQRNGDQIALGVMPGQSGSFTLDFTSVAGLPYGSLLFLEDKSEGTWTQVAEGDVSAFTMTELDDYNRFAYTLLNSCKR